MTILTKVANLRREPYTIYIGRKDQAFHFGNPFSIGKSKLSTTVVRDRHEALMAFHDWLAGTRFKAGDPDEIEPKRREWILSNLDMLRGETLGCFCKPSGCHGDVYRVFLKEISLEQALGSSSRESAPVEKRHASEETVQMGLF